MILHEGHVRLRSTFNCDQVEVPNIFNRILIFGLYGKDNTLKRPQKIIYVCLVFQQKKFDMIKRIKNQYFQHMSVS